MPGYTVDSLAHIVVWHLPRRLAQLATVQNCASPVRGEYLQKTLLYFPRSIARMEWFKCKRPVSAGDACR
jgi:hypothetical protein